MSMRKIVFAMFAVCAFAALSAATASAEETLLANWLLNNTTVLETTLNTTVAGTLILEDTKTIAGAAAVECKATADGTVGANGSNKTEAILNADSEATGPGKPLLGTGAASGLGSECKATKVCAAGSATSPIEVTPLGLPWSTLLYLMADGKILNYITGVGGTGGTIGYALLCLVFGINTTDECNAPANVFSVEVANVSEDAAIPAGAETEPEALCSQSGEETGKNIAKTAAAIMLEGTELLSVSSE